MPGDNPHHARPKDIDPRYEPWIARTLSSMSLEQQVGQLMVVRTVPRAPAVKEALDECFRLVKQIEPGGFYAGGKGSPQEREMLDALQERSPVPLLFCADFEAGVGLQWPEAGTRFPMPLALGAVDDPEATRASAVTTAIEARALGIHWNLAPVCDVNLNPDNPVINVRSFGDNPGRVANHAEAYVEGLQSERVLACAKHFPGSGRASTDSHQTLPTVVVDRDELRATDLVPFRRAIAAGVKSVMIGHVYMPSIMGPTPVSANLSYEAVTGLLRNEMGFDGLVVTDSLKMQSVSAHFTPGESAVTSLLAGADIILLSPDPLGARAAVLEAVGSGRISRDRIAASVARVLRAKAWCGLAAPAGVGPRSRRAHVGTEESLAFSKELASRAVTVVSDDDGLLPLRKRTHKGFLHIALVDSQNRWREREVAAATEVFRRHLNDVRYFVALQNPRARIAARFDPACAGLRPEEVARRVALGESRRSELLLAAMDAEAVILTIHRYTRGYSAGPGLSDDEASLIAGLRDLHVPTVVAVFGSPYVLNRLPGMSCRIAACDWSDNLAEGTARVIVGEVPAAGRLPVRLR